MLWARGPSRVKSKHFERNQRFLSKLSGRIPRRKPSRTVDVGDRRLVVPGSGRVSLKVYILFISKLDRLARSTGDLYAILGRLKEKGVGFRCLDNSEIDTTTKHGKLLLGVLALIADFESDIRHERQMEGIAKAKERGVAFGRQPKLSAAQISELRRRRGEGAERRDLMKAYGISKASFYRLLKLTD
jgi:DNA invertase Pin-like site-specific DNA recombinase